MKEKDHIIPNLTDWPIAKFYNDRARIVDLLTSTTVDNIKSSANGDLAQILNQTIYAEKIRVKTNPLNVDPPREYSYWAGLESTMSKASVDANGGKEVYDNAVKKVIHRYAEEIAGNFYPSTYNFASKALSWLFRIIYNPFAAKGQRPFWGSVSDLHKKIRIEGPIDHIRELFDKGTVVILPTHFSNLDSIMIGYAIAQLTGLPAFSYAAGLNLYDFEILAYYMSRLGAYKIDRRKKNPIYSQTIKQFSALSILEGLNSIFFIGGGRARDGMLEKNIKLGLLSTLIDAQNEFYLRSFEKKIIVVPMVVSYHFVFEAESLIQQHLRKLGKENYLVKRGPNKTSLKTIRFIRRLFKSDTNVTISFGKPIDVFGNELDKQGNSIKQGKFIDIREYFKHQESVNIDRQRNRVYTRHLADTLVKSYKQENIVLSSHVVCFVAFQMFRKQYPNMEIYNLVNLPNDYFSIQVSNFCIQLKQVVDELKQLESQGEVKLSPEIVELQVEDLLKDGIKNVNSYHFYAPLLWKKDVLICEDLRLLYFYHNRMSGYKLERIIEIEPIKTFKLKKAVF